MSNYSYHGLGCDRTTSAWGTGYAGDYAPPNTAMFNSVETCPTNLLLWFHNLAWSHPMPKPRNFKPYSISNQVATKANTGDGVAVLANASEVDYTLSGNETITLYELIRFTHFDVVEQAKVLASKWDELDGLIDAFVAHQREEHPYQCPQCHTVNNDCVAYHTGACCCFFLPLVHLGV